MPREDASARDHDEWEAPVTVRRIALETLVAVGLGLIAAIAVTWPLVTKLGHTGHDAFDPRFQAWTIDWVQHKLASPGSLFDANIFAPEPHTLAYSDSLLGIAIPMLPFRWLGVSPIGQLNIALLFSFATTFASGYLFGRVVTRSIVVGALTGVAFAFGPFGSVSSGVIHATAHAGVGVAAAAAWWLADRARARTTTARTECAARRRAGVAGVGLLLSRCVRIRRGCGDPARALAFARTAGVALGRRCARGRGRLRPRPRDPVPPGAQRPAGIQADPRRPPPAGGRLRRHGLASVHLGIHPGQGRRLADLRRARVPGPVPPRPRTRRRDRGLALGRPTPARHDRRARARGRRPRTGPGRRTDRVAAVRAVPAALRVRAGLGSPARHRPGVGGRPARRGVVGRLRRARDRSLARPHASSGAPAR